MELNEAFIENLAVEPGKIIDRIAQELSVRPRQVEAVVTLLKDGNTVPFISRYRKEMTGSLDEIQVRDIDHRSTSLENLETRRIEIVKSIFAQGKLTEELYNNIQKCDTLTELEDIYAPYKKKKKTRGMIAIEKGLEPLADKMLELTDAEIEKLAQEFIDEEKGVADADAALQGAMDILAERMSQDMENRKVTRDFVVETAEVAVSGKGNPDESTYQMYYDYRDPVKYIKPHRVLAINRGEREGELEVRIEVDNDGALKQVEQQIAVHNAYHKLALADGFKRLLLPAILREIRSVSTEDADEHGIGIFAENLKNLLLTPPIKKTRVLGIDPGIRTGTKAAALDETGKFLDYILFYQHNKEESEQKLADFVKKYHINLIAVGNGTGSHEVQEVVAGAIQKHSLDAQYTVVSEDGASVYSASKLAGEEFPKLDLTIRGAISIGRRLQDPLAELVKIDPKSIGVGLYQHDLNQKSLGEKLSEVVESVVNNVGVNLNTASYSLLRYVSGVNQSLAKNIVDYRDTNGEFVSREDLNKVPGMGAKTFEQAAGFLKIPGASNPLDNTWVHPENYAIAGDIRNWLAHSRELNRQAREELKQKYGVGNTTLDDILQELQKPSRDPREDYPQPILQKGVVQFEDLKVGMKVKGKVKNVVDFGAFVDIGIKETALVHISELSDKYVKHPMDAISVGDVKDFRIIQIDPVRKRIGLSLKTPAETPRR